MVHIFQKIFGTACVAGSLLFCLPVRAQYAPQAGLPGSTAIPATSGLIKSWASECRLYRGFVNIDSPLLGRVVAGDSSAATGFFDNTVVSLGDSGVAVVSFPGLLYDAPGFDFAVFENGFRNPVNDSQAFLELAFVGVSSDGVNFATFPARSVVATTRQIRGAGDYMYANQVHNLAGKYVGGFGTPFDLAELKDYPGVDINRISHIRITDVTGSVNSVHASRDAGGNLINDPFPTAFPTGGFDLDAVAAMSFAPRLAVPAVGTIAMDLTPNPVTSRLFFRTNAKSGTLTITELDGRVVSGHSLDGGEASIDVSGMAAGTYSLVVITENGEKCARLFVKS